MRMKTLCNLWLRKQQDMIHYPVEFCGEALESDVLQRDADWRTTGHQVQSLLSHGAADRHRSAPGRAPARQWRYSSLTRRESSWIEKAQDATRDLILFLPRMSLVINHQTMLALPEQGELAKIVCLSTHQVLSISETNNYLSVWAFSECKWTGKDVLNEPSIKRTRQYLWSFHH